MSTSSASTKSGGVFWSSDSELMAFRFQFMSIFTTKKTTNFIPPPPHRHSNVASMQKQPAM